MCDRLDVLQKSTGEPEPGGFLFDFFPGTGVWVPGLVLLLMLLIMAASACLLLGSRSWIWNLSSSACVMVGCGARVVSQQKTDAERIRPNADPVFLFSAGLLPWHA